MKYSLNIHVSILIWKWINRISHKGYTNSLCGMQRVIALSLTLLGKQWKEVKVTQFVNLSSGIRAFCLDILYVR